MSTSTSLVNSHIYVDKFLNFYNLTVQKHKLSVQSIFKNLNFLWNVFEKEFIENFFIVLKLCLVWLESPSLEKCLRNQSYSSFQNKTYDQLKNKHFLLKDYRDFTIADSAMHELEHHTAKLLQFFFFIWIKSHING